MTATRTLRPILILACIIALAACGGPRDVPAIGPPSDAEFGDRKPFDWPGRTPQSYPVHGIDVARYQSNIDWARAHRSGVSFAFIKATEGGDRIDPQFHQHWSGAAAAHIARGAYHFYYFCTSAEVQARWFIANVPRTRGALPPVLDLEWNPFSPSCKLRPPAETVRREARTFLGILERHYGQRPIVYTTPQFYAENGMGQLRDVEFWLRSTAAHPSEKYPDERWSFWQYSATGIIPGARGDIDLNAFYGSRAAWSAWLAARQAK